MTPIDLRIKYRFETGDSPTYGKDSYGHNYKGGLTHEYAEWIETYTGENGTFMSMNWQRYYFIKDTGLHATYYDKHKKLRYRKEYKDWLEQLLCRALSTFEK